MAVEYHPWEECQQQGHFENANHQLQQQGLIILDVLCPNCWDVLIEIQTTFLSLPERTLTTKFAPQLTSTSAESPCGSHGRSKESTKIIMVMTSMPVNVTVRRRSLRLCHRDSPSHYDKSLLLECTSAPFLRFIQKRNQKTLQTMQHINWSVLDDALKKHMMLAENPLF